MSREEKESLPIIVFDKRNKLEIIIPQDAQLNEFLDSEKFGVWIDGKKVNNNNLKNYSKTDFSSVYISEVNANAVSSKNQQPFQVNLFTHKYFEKINNQESIQVGIRKNFYDSDTIKPKAQKVEKIKAKNTEMIPPPPPVKEITSQTEAEFPGGPTALRNKLAENFDSSKLKDSKGTLKGVLIIIVSEDGKSYNANYQFDDENFKTAAKEALEKTLEGVVWKPGTLNGKPVASQFKMPITMSFK